MELSLLERWMVSNQLRILEALYPDEAEELAIQREAIEAGYEFVYDIIHPTDPETMTEADGRKVWNTLDMFRAIDYSIRKLETDDFEDHYFRKFHGYDGNNETKFMAFASYTIERLERWTDLPLNQPGVFNSHSPMRDHYQRMLEVWEDFPLEERFRMNSRQVQAVLDAA